MIRKLAVNPHLALLTALLALASARASAEAKASARPATQGGKARTRGPKVSKNAPVVLYAVNQRETMPLKLRDAHGRPVKGLQRRFDHFLRCHHTNTQHKMDPRLMKLLFQTGHHWPGRRLEIVSGYRHPTVAKNPHSPHMKGLACDFRVEGVKTADLRDYLRRTFEKVGVGYYPNSSFVHLDVRKDRSAFWIDYSGPGERAIYSATPDQDLKSGRADSYHPTKIDTSWADAPPPPPDPDGRAPAASEAE
ncbi:MAG TPA: DUF882 domain-containing protein [Polyangia bacterium]|nr:DUF882 domain-containing protein [Polyangia bacterium]